MARATDKERGASGRFLADPDDVVFLERDERQRRVAATPATDDEGGDDEYGEVSDEELAEMFAPETLE